MFQKGTVRSNGYLKRRIIGEYFIPNGLSYFNLAVGDYEVWLVGRGGQGTSGYPGAAGGVCIHRFKNTTTYSILFSSGNVYLKDSSNGSGTTIATANAASGSTGGTASGGTETYNSSNAIGTNSGGGACFSRRGIGSEFLGGCGVGASGYGSSGGGVSSGQCAWTGLINKERIKPDSNFYWWTPWDWFGYHTGGSMGGTVSTNADIDNAHIKYSGGPGGGGASGNSQSATAQGGGLMAGGGSSYGSENEAGVGGFGGGGGRVASTTGAPGGGSFCLIYWK